MNNYTTGQAAGFTSLPVKTIQRYIKDYPDAFSVTAKQPSKGRRYTSQDIKNLLTIRQLYKMRESQERIRDALAGKWIPESIPMMEIENALHVVQVTNEAMTESKGHAIKAQNERRILEGDVIWIKKNIKEIIEALEAQENEIYRLRQLIGVITNSKNQNESKKGW